MLGENEWSPLLYPPTRSLVRRQEGDQAVAWRRTVAEAELEGERWRCLAVACLDNQT